jgi:DNA (cytosine-5)-methyltransferase 1
MQFLSVCSGIEAASVAWGGLGFEALAFSEIEPFPSAVLAHHYPAVPNLGDMTLASQWGKYDPNILVGGTPCQSFSVAGLRKGLADPRGNLMLTYLAIADRYQPEWVVWENVPGVLSSGHGRDFGTFLGALGQIGYGWAYRVLDAQFFGVPQRRRRVFVVGHLGDWRRAAAVLFERHSLQGHPAPSREKREGVTAGTLRCADGGSDVGRGIAGHLQAFGGNNTAGPIDVATACNACASASGRMDFESETFVAHSLRAEGFDASEDGTGRGTPLVPVVAGPLLSGSSSPAAHGKKNGTDRETLIPIAFDCKASGQNGFSVGEIASTMRSMGHAGSHQNGGGHQAVAFQPNQSGVRVDDIHATPDSNNGSRCHNGALAGMQVRRLTPRECERLQGFPDDYTQVSYRNKPAADGPRYKALGNSMAVPVMRWIGERIQLVDWLLSEGT